MTQDGLIEANHRLIAERDEARARVAELEAKRDHSQVVDALNPVFDVGVTASCMPDLSAEVARLTANNSALRETIAELEAKLEAREDGEPEETPFDWIKAAVHAGDVKEIRDEFSLLERQLETQDRLSDIAYALAGGLVRYVIGKDPDDVYAGSELVNIVDKFMRRK